MRKRPSNCPPDDSNLSRAKPLSRRSKRLSSEPKSLSRKEQISRESPQTGSMGDSVLKLNCPPDIFGPEKDVIDYSGADCPPDKSILAPKRRGRVRMTSLPYVPMDPHIDENPKIGDFIDILVEAGSKIPEAYLVEVAQKIYKYCGRKAADGILGHISDRSLERIVRADIPGHVLRKAFLSAGLLHEDANLGLIVHDWDQYGGLVLAKRKGDTEARAERRRRQKERESAQTASEERDKNRAKEKAPAYFELSGGHPRVSGSEVEVEVEVKNLKTHTPAKRRAPPDDRFCGWWDSYQAGKQTILRRKRVMPVPAGRSGSVLRRRYAEAIASGYSHEELVAALDAFFADRWRREQGNVALFAPEYFFRNVERWIEASGETQTRLRVDDSLLEDLNQRKILTEAPRIASLVVNGTTREHVLEAVDELSRTGSRVTRETVQKFLEAHPHA